VCGFFACGRISGLACPSISLTPSLPPPTLLPPFAAANWCFCITYLLARHTIRYPSPSLHPSITTPGYLSLSLPSLHISSSPPPPLSLSHTSPSLSSLLPSLFISTSFFIPQLARHQHSLPLFCDTTAHSSRRFLFTSIRISNRQLYMEQVN
jgi:hypothetical protein